MNENLKRLIQVANDETMFPEVLKFLSTGLHDHEEENREIRRALSTNKSLPVEILEKMGKDDDVIVRRNALKHPLATDKMLEKALKDEDVDVRTNAVKNPNVTEEVLVEFLKDENKNISQLAKQNLTARWM